MTGFVMFLHALVSVLLLVIILMQSGRGGGLTEGFASAESMFGAQTNEFMIKATTVFAGLFLITCLGLAVLSSQKGKSLMSGEIASQAPQVPITDSIVDTAVKESESVGEVPVAETVEETIAEPITEMFPDDVPAGTIP